MEQVNFGFLFLDLVFLMLILQVNAGGGMQSRWWFNSQPRCRQAFWSWFNKDRKKILLKKLLVGQSEALSEDLSSPSSTGSCTCVLYWVMTYCKLRTVQLACTVSVSSNCWSLVWWALPFLLVNETFWFIELPSLFFFFFPSDVGFYQKRA